MNGYRAATACLTLLLLAGCASTASYDYTDFEANPPRSILVLPPQNETPAVEATYGYLSTVTRPLAEHGFYVFPVQLMDAMLKDNGLPTAGEMHGTSLEALREITGADAVLYITVERYGSSYQVINSSTTVSARARLVSTADGALLWQGRASAGTSSGISGNLVADAITAAITQGINSTRDEARRISRLTNQQLVARKNVGLPYGPYSPRAGTTP